MAKHRYDTEATRADLLRSGRELFSDRGYAATTIEMIVSGAGLTRGALYHHFDGKADVFRAVLEAVQQGLTAEVGRRAAAAREAGPTESLRAGFHAYLDVALRDDIRRILLIDGPAVVGWAAWQEIDFRHAFGVTRAGVERAVDAGEIAPVPVDELVHVLLGAVMQAGLELGRSGAGADRRRSFGAVIDRLVDGLRVEPAAGP